MSAPPITIPGTQVHTLHSDIVGDDYEISVILPPPGFASGPVPVVYLTDANLLAPTAASAGQLLTFGGEIPPVQVVGVGYPTRNPAELQRLRHRDMTPAPNDAWKKTLIDLFGPEIGDPEMGGAPAFLDFLTKELHPWVKEHYPVTDDSTIFGVSTGGLFVTWALFHHPEAFKRYIIGSPGLYYDLDNAPHWEAAYAAAHSDLDAAVFLAAGEDEHIPGAYATEEVGAINTEDEVIYTRRLADALASRNYPSLRLTPRILPEETHWTLASGALLPQGLRHVFAKDGSH